MRIRSDMLRRSWTSRVVGDRRGSIAIIVALMLPVLLGVTGLTIDVGLAYATKRQLQDATQAAALAGAAELARPGATAVSVAAAVAAWNQSDTRARTLVSSSSTEVSCDATLRDVPACTSAAPNMVSVTQRASIQTHFLKALGKTSIDLASTAVAASGGGEARKVNIMFVLDRSAENMGITLDICTVPGIDKPTHLDCALSEIQNILKVLSTAQMSASLMVYPGYGPGFDPVANCNGAEPYLIDSINRWQHVIYPYYGPDTHYQIGITRRNQVGTFDNTFNDGAGNLVKKSPLVQAVGNFPSLKPCVMSNNKATPEEVFGHASASEAIKLAQAAFPKDGQGVMIVMSNGVSQAWQSELYPGGVAVYETLWKNQCQQAVEAARAATAAGTLVYSVAYQTMNINGCQSDSPHVLPADRKTAKTTPWDHNPCATMQDIASDRSMFYTNGQNEFVRDQARLKAVLAEAGLPDTNGQPCPGIYTAKPVADLKKVFLQSPAFTKPRLVSIR